jgi:flagellar hook assembly protein FlgD
VRIEIFNVLGQRVSVLVDEEQTAGFYSTVWSGKDDHGYAVGSGMYICRMTAGEFTVSRKLILVR